MALFSSEKILDFFTVAFCLFVTNLFRKLQTNCAISFCFLLYLVLHAYATRFDVTEDLEKFLNFGVN